MYLLNVNLLNVLYVVYYIISVDCFAVHLGLHDSIPFDIFDYTHP